MAGIFTPGLVYLDASVLIWLVQPRLAKDYPQERKAAGRILQLGMWGQIALRTSSLMRDEHSKDPATSKRIGGMRKRCRVATVSHALEGAGLDGFVLDYHRLGPVGIASEFQPTFDLIRRERGETDANHVCTVLVDGGFFVSTDLKLVGTAERNNLPGVLRPTAFIASLTGRNLA